jgi:hypothetical protein
MADEHEPSPRGVGNFLLCLGVAAVAALVVFLIVFYFNGHKASLMKNSLLHAPSQPTEVVGHLPADGLLAFSADFVPSRS